MTWSVREFSLNFMDHRSTTLAVQLRNVITHEDRSQKICFLSIAPWSVFEKDEHVHHQWQIPSLAHKQQRTGFHGYIALVGATAYYFVHWVSCMPFKFLACFLRQLHIDITGLCHLMCLASSERPWYSSVTIYRGCTWLMPIWTIVLWKCTACLTSASDDGGVRMLEYLQIAWPLCSYYLWRERKLAALQLHCSALFWCRHQSERKYSGRHGPNGDGSLAILNNR